MRPILFQRWGVTVRSYSAMLYTGLVTGVVAGNLAAHAEGLDSYHVFVATFLLLIPALIGARLLYVVSHWGRYRRDPRRIWNRNDGGAAQYGGILLALPLSAPVLGALRLSWGGFWDAAIFTILTGMIFARVGCLLNGCCAGRYVRGPGVVRHGRLPTQCLEAGWACILLILAIVVRQKMAFPGALFWTVAAGYAAGRLVLESTREPRPGAGSFTIHHGISAALIAVSLGVLVTRWPK